MKRWLKNCRILVMCLAAILLLGTALPVQAAPPETGTLKILLKEKESRVEFAVYKVAGYEDGTYTVYPEFARINDSIEHVGDKIDLNNMTDAAELERCAELLSSWTKTQQMKPLYQEYTTNGILNLGEVSVGMFLVTQISHEDDELEALPFLVGVPYWKIVTDGEQESKVLEYFVESVPKVEPIVPKPEPPKPEPPKPEPPKPNPPKSNVKTEDEMHKWVTYYGILMIASGGVAFLAERRRQNKKNFK